ncbi:MAG: hypothetical protein WD045_13955 [Pirellulaceae bacterium]
MRKFLLPVALVVAGLVLTSELLSLHSMLLAQRTNSPAVASELMFHSVTAPDGGQNIVLVDPSTRVMGVYHVDSATGKVSLKSVRNLQWDLLIEDFNSGAPTPREIRTMVGRQ